MRIHLNGMLFEKTPLEQFGVKLMPLHQAAVPLQPWIRNNVKAVSAYVRENSLVVVSDVLDTQDSTWDVIEPTASNASSSFPHVDRADTTKGPNDALLWLLHGDKRSPTAFVRGSVITTSMRRKKEQLLSLDQAKLYPKHRSYLQNASDFLLSNHWPTDIYPVSRIAIMLYREELWDRLHLSVTTRETFWDRCLNRLLGIPNSRSPEDYEAERDSLQRIRQVMSEYRNAILNDCTDDIYFHDWKSSPRSGLLVWNNPSKPSDCSNDYVAHFADNRSVSPGECNLARAKIHNEHLFT